MVCLSCSGTWTRIQTIWQTLSCRLPRANGGPEGESIHWGEVASVNAHNPWLKRLTLLICALFPPQMATLCGRSCLWRRRRLLFHFLVLLENSTGLSFVLGNCTVYVSGDTLAAVCPLMSLFSKTKSDFFSGKGISFTQLITVTILTLLLVEETSPKTIVHGSPFLRSCIAGRYQEYQYPTFVERNIKFCYYQY